MPRSIDPRSYESPEGERPAVTPPIELERRPHDPYAAFRFGDFTLFTAGNLLSITGRLMLAVAVEWEIYARTHSATALGLVGLVIAVPVVTLSLPAGHLADRFSRKHIILVSQVFSGLTSLALALVSWKHLAIPPLAPLRAGNRALASVAAIFERHHPVFHFDDASIPLIYLLLFLGAIARTFRWAARSSFFPTLVPRDADLCRSNPARWTCWSRVAASRAGDRRFRRGAGCGAFAPDETGRPNFDVVCHGIWHCNYSFRLIQNILVIAWRVISCRRVRQRERDHPRVDRPTGHSG